MDRRHFYVIPFALAAAAVVDAEPPASQPAEQVYRQWAVACDHPVASQAGAEMLRQGGNAVDAAVAASFCLSVVRPYSCGIGGGGFMIICDPGGADRAPFRTAINYRETAPGAVDAEYYARLDDAGASHTGGRAVGVPGTVAGLLWALEHHGSLDRQTVMAPAIRAASAGFHADPHHVKTASALARRLGENPAAKPGSAFLWQTLCRNGEIATGEVIVNPDQARALRLIARDGRDAFYTGRIASAIVDAAAASGGVITLADLAGYRIRVTEPLVATFAGYELVAMPPPSSGGITMLQILGLMERRLDELGPVGHDSPAYLHLLAESMKHAFADRAVWLADADFVEVPTDRLLSAAYLNRRASMISMTRTHEGAFYGALSIPDDDGGTSHISAIDGRGVAVACTETINLEYGSLVVVPGYGFALNDEMDDFTTVANRANKFGLRQSERNLPAPGKRPLSSMSPTIVLAAGRPVIVAGASGGPRIITATVQSILNCLLFDMRPAEAVGAPRIHHQWMPDVLELEPTWTDGQAAAGLEAIGHVTSRGTREAAVQLIGIDRDGIRAASDPRKGGRPEGE